MKKVIEGKMYNTETAECVAEWDNGRGASDFSHVYEDLYRKRTGEYFIHGAGGPASKYAKSCGQNEWSGGEAIIPLTLEAAQQWAEENLSGEEYETIFGEVQEDSSRCILSVSVRADNAEKARRFAAQKGVSLSSIIDAWMSELDNT